MPSSSTTCPDAAGGCRATAREASGQVRPTAGFTLVTMLFILVVLAALGAALAGISMRQQMGSAADIDSARALQGARAGLEWATFEVLRYPPPPAAAPACFGTTSFGVAGLSGITITVSCTRTPASGSVNDGATELAFFQLVATACNIPSGGACPASGTPPPAYVERQLSGTVAR
jgi:MSHA biogenesis protein MshP